MLTEIFKQALHSLNRFRLRSLLTLLGIAWGIACFVILIAYGSGFGNALSIALHCYGDSVNIIWNGQTSLQAGGQKAGRRIRMEMKDIEDLRSGVPLLRHVSVEFFGNFVYKTVRKRTSANASGIDENWALIRSMPLEVGRTFTSEDIRFARRVLILGYDLKRKIFSEARAEGEEVRLDGVPFTVIGVLRKKVQIANSYNGSDDEKGFLPYTAFGTLRQARYPGAVLFQPVADEMESKAIRQVRQVFAHNHQFSSEDTKALFFNAWSEAAQAFTFMILGMRIFLVVIGFMTLGVGAVGVMNVMLVSVTERTREIGTRKALGARRRHILFQFLAEALVICILGGILGLLFSQAVAAMIGVVPFLSSIMNDPTRQGDIHLLITWQSILISSCCLTLVGLVSGMIPAFRASRMDPMVALRHE